MKKFTMKKIALKLTFKSLVVTTLIFSFCFFAGRNFQYSEIVLLYYLGGVVAILYICGVYFRLAYVWEIKTERMVIEEGETVARKFLVSDLIMDIVAWLIVALVVVTLLSISDRYDHWLGSIWKPLQIIAGLPSFLSAIIMFIIVLGSYYVRNDYCYETQEKQNSYYYEPDQDMSVHKLHGLKKESAAKA